jgi:hypothetical protein
VGGWAESGKGNLQTVAAEIFLLEQFQMKEAKVEAFRHSKHMILFLNHVFDRQILNRSSMTVR